MQAKKLVIVSVAAVTFGAAAFAAAAVRRPAAPPPAPTPPVSRALQLRSLYNPFLLQRQDVIPAQARANAIARIAAAAVRPPYRPETRSPYQPPTRGPYIQ